MTKEELRKIYFLNKEIKMWQKELEKLQCQSLIKGQEITGMPFSGSGNADKVGDMAVEMADTETIIKGKLAEIQIQRKKIVEYIAGIEDSEERQIIFYRCVSCMDWTQIAKEMGEGYSADAIKQKYYRHFKKCHSMSLTNGI